MSNIKEYTSEELQELFQLKMQSNFHPEASTHVNISENDTPHLHARIDNSENPELELQSIIKFLFPTTKVDTQFTTVTPNQTDESTGESPIDKAKRELSSLFDTVKNSKQVETLKSREYWEAIAEKGKAAAIKGRDKSLEMAEKGKLFTQDLVEKIKEEQREAQYEKELKENKSEVTSEKLIDLQILLYEALDTVQELSGFDVRDNDDYPSYEESLNSFTPFNEDKEEVFEVTQEELIAINFLRIVHHDPREIIYAIAEMEDLDKTLKSLSQKLFDNGDPLSDNLQQEKFTKAIKGQISFLVK